jgi:hypothetical protein
MRLCWGQLFAETLFVEIDVGTAFHYFGFQVLVSIDDLGSQM